MTKARLGRISYLNVLPVYHALESGAVAHDFELVYGPPADLNNLMAAGGMAASSCSCVEYARRPEKYLLLPNLAIGSKGPVQSVLMLSRRPVEQLSGKRILVSAETHTSATLLRILLKEKYGLRDLGWFTGSATEMTATGNPPEAFLAIGDEALRLRRHPAYPHMLDLGDAWTEWTGLPFIFGLWVARRDLPRNAPECDPARLLSASRDWGLENMDAVLDIAVQNYPNMTRDEHADYFAGLHYNLGEKELSGLCLFWKKLAEAGEIPYAPEPEFFPI